MKYTILEKLTALREKLSVRKAGTRLLALLLTLVLLQGDLMLSAYSAGEDSGETTEQSNVTENTTVPTAPEQAEAEPEVELPVDEDTLVITQDGAETTAVSLLPYEKVELKAEGLESDAEYQWQIRHPETGAWINIYDATEQCISVSTALVKNMLNKDGTAALRCRAYTEEYAYLSNSIRVTLLEGTEPVDDSVQLLSLDDPAVPLADGDLVPEFVTVTIEYKTFDFKRDNQDKLIMVDGKPALEETGKTAFTSYMATLHGGGELKTTVHFPTIVGYDAYWENDETPSTQHTFNFDSVTQDLTYTVKYKPALVNYTVRYFFQNIYDDLFVEDTSKKITDTGYTGATPPDSQLDAEMTGFTALYHQPDAIAADGSTVFEVYYERNYYLMEFDCNGGFGADTVYVRYGSHISVPNPTKPGYVFGNNGDGNGWDLVKTEQAPTPTLGDEVGDPLPATMPAYNSGYKAIWDTINTTYTIAYWIENSDGTYTSIGSRVGQAESSTTVSGSDDLAQEDAQGDKITNICGLAEHTHTNSCYICGNANHTHTENCYVCGKVGHTHDKNSCYSSCTHVHTLECYEYTSGGLGYGDLDAIQNVNDGNENPESGHVYTINATGDNTTYYKFYFDGQWYGGSSSMLSGTPLGKGTYYDTSSSRTWTANKYLALAANCSHNHTDECLSCTEHTHGGACFSCGLDAHAHTDSCYADDQIIRFIEFAKADQNVHVEGDGSTVVNVYYTYKTYNLKFYYAKKEGNKYYIAGGSTWAFSGDTNNVSTQLSSLASGVWGEVKTLPVINSTKYKTGSDEYTVNGATGTYYYLQFSAKYNADVSTIWPVGIFEKVEVADSNKVSFGDYAYFSAWNVDANTWYDNSNDNKTMKGSIQRLDYQMLIDYRTNLADRDTIHFLAFWENAVSGLTWNKPHQWTYNIYIPAPIGATENIHEYNGIKYNLYGTYVVYDDNDHTKSASNYYQQTPPALEGYTIIGCNLSSQEQYDTDNQLYKYQLDFYYTAQESTLSFYNYNKYIDLDTATTGSQTSTTVPYGTNLSSHLILADSLRTYPDTLEPKAYVFGGWYTTPQCLPHSQFGTVQYDDKGNYSYTGVSMPNGNLTLYAKWTPIMRDVIFYSAYSDIQKDKDDTSDKIYHFMKAENILHGTTLGSTYFNTPEWPQDLDPAINGGAQAEMYDFVGWFYMDENGKKKFAPDSMEVTRNLVLFAEWQTSVDTSYEVQYVLAEDVKDKALPSGKDYNKGDPVGDTISAHSSVGKTKTFNAKGGTDLYSDFQTHFFPTVNSHSILMEQDGNLNKFTFEYRYDDVVYYKVRYVDYTTRTELRTPKVVTSEKSIVTEKFLPIEGYLPQNYYITKALAYDGNATIPIEENVITFYYTKDTEHGLYSVEYYLENPSSDDDSDPANYYQYESIIGSDDNGLEFVAQIRTYEGYTHVPGMNTVITYNTDGTEKNVEKGVQKDKENGDYRPYGIIDYTGLTIKIYYKRNSYPYTIEYREYGSDALLKTVEDSRAKFDTDKTHVAETSFEIDGLTYEYYIDNADEAARTKTMTIRVPVEDNPDTYEDETFANKLTFYYKKHEVTVHYVAVCKTPDATGFGGLSFYNERAATASALGGSNATPGSGFEFMGWYTDAKCTAPVDVSWRYTPGTAGTLDVQADNGTKLKPGTLDVSASVTDVYYYALFAPITTNLTITKTVTGDLPAGMANDDTFLFHVKGQGKHEYLELTVAVTVNTGTGSVTIVGIPLDEYQVTELTAWSWEYAVSGESVKTIVLETNPSKNVVPFTNTYANPDWLGGESAVTDNIFN